MKRPFNIFPNIGYRNSQFQVVSTVDNLKIDIFLGKNLVTTVHTNSKHPALILHIDVVGKLVAKCKYNKEVFHQEIEIEDSFRLGSSEFKKAFVFEDTNYSFLIFKDRLLLYDEEKKVLLTENHYSPTKIQQVNESCYLFVTEVGDGVNLGIYNTDSFSIVGELLNNYKEVRIIADANKAWLFNIASKTIHCFELVNNKNTYFLELDKFSEFETYSIDEFSQNLFLHYKDKIKIISLQNIHQVNCISKLDNNAIDKFGNEIVIKTETLEYNSLFANKFTLKKSFETYLQTEKYLHIGINITKEKKLEDLDSRANEIKKDLISLIPKRTYLFEHLFPKNNQVSETHTVDHLYSTIGGVYKLTNRTIRTFEGVRLRDRDGWRATAIESNDRECTVHFLSDKTNYTLLRERFQPQNVEHHNSVLLLSFDEEINILSGKNNLKVEKGTGIKLITVNEIDYILLNSNDEYLLYRSNDFNQPLLNKIIVLNLEFINEHQIIWFYRRNDINNIIHAFDLKTSSDIAVDLKRLEHSSYKNPLNLKFFNNYALSSSDVVFNPKTLQIKGTFLGEIESNSQNLNKLFVRRGNTVYISLFNSELEDYELLEIALDKDQYKESYLSPNGRFLVLQNESNEYVWHDIEKNESIRFISGNFLSFKKDGSLIIEDDRTRAVKILDPETFKDITPSNYHHFRFLSPDGKLYAQVSAYGSYVNLLTGNDIEEEEVRKIKNDLDGSRYSYSRSRGAESEKLKKNRKQLFESNIDYFEGIGITDYKEVRSDDFIIYERYTQIGIVGTDIFTEIIFPDDLVYYNYSAFSYDNKFFGYVGKPSSNGLIHLFKIDFDEEKKEIFVTDDYLSRYPNYASWVCGFSKTGYFATYDSSPDTYILTVDDNLFEKKTSETELENKIFKSTKNIFHSYKNFMVIRGKNFLCFSPNGEYLALSEQGYEPLTLGGYGHQESNAVHIAETRTGKLIDSFVGHGSMIKDDKSKKVTFAAFSEDSKRIMTLSSDGVVIVRELNIRNLTENKRKKTPVVV